MAETRLLLPLQIGHESEMLDTLTPSGQTQFRWTVFVRSAGSLQFTDRSFINKVVFELHPDFVNPKRTVKEPPFEVTETGYAGFTIPLQISFMGVSKTYKLNYDMNLVLEKQSKHYVEQLLLIKQPSNEFYELALKYGARIKKEKRKKEKHHGERDYEGEPDFQRYDAVATSTTTEKVVAKKKKIYQSDSRAETSVGASTNNEHKAVAVPTTSAAIPSKNFSSRKMQKANEEYEKNEKSKSSRVVSPVDRSRGIVNGRASPLPAAVVKPKNPSPTSAKDASGSVEERGKTMLGDTAASAIVPSSSASSAVNLNKSEKMNRKPNSPADRIKNGQREKSTERQKCAIVNGEKLKSSPSESTKGFIDEQSPPAKKRKHELSVDTLLAVQKSLMDIENSERMFAVVDAIFSSSEWPVPSLEYSEDTKILSFDLFALDPALILRLEELCQR